MPVKFVDKFKVGFMPILQADEGHLLAGRMVETGRSLISSSMHSTT